MAVTVGQQHPILTIHRSAHEIGGNCIEIAYDGHRLLLDAGWPLNVTDDGDTDVPLPSTLDVSRPVDALVISHPHQDHYGLLRGLPREWPVWCGASAEVLIRMTAAASGRKPPQTFNNYRSFVRFTVGPFSITPFLTDHSAFDAHMLLIECGGRRLLYSGDFRRVGRKSGLVDRLMKDPPPGLDVLLLEGTTLGRTEGFPTESELEAKFAALFRRTRGRVFVTWSAQNVDRTVTIYRACKQTGRTLVLDLYSVDVLERLAAQHDRLPSLGWPNLRAVVTGRMKWLYENPERLNSPEFVTRCAQSGHAMSAETLAARYPQAVVMLRSSLLEDFARKGLRLIAEDAWVFSMWSGYLRSPEYASLRRACNETGVAFEQIHTSGHASEGDLRLFAECMAPRFLVPIHSFEWDQHLNRFPNVHRLKDGEAFVVP